MPNERLCAAIVAVVFLCVSGYSLAADWTQQSVTVVPGQCPPFPAFSFTDPGNVRAIDIRDFVK